MNAMCAYANTAYSTPSAARGHVYLVTEKSCTSQDLYQYSGCSQELPLYHSTKKWWTFENYIQYLPLYTTASSHSIP